MEGSRFAFAGWKSADVAYDRYDEVFDLSICKGFAGKSIRSVFASVQGRDIGDITGRANMDAFMSALVIHMPFLKHAGFREEREYRIAMPRIPAHKIAKGKELAAKEIKFRCRDGLIIPYIEISSDPNEHLPIKGIIVGPHPSQQRQVDSLKMVLAKIPLADIDVRISGIPFR